MSEGDKEGLKVNLDALSNALSRMKMPLSKSLQDLSEQLQAMSIALPFSPKQETISNLCDKVEGAIADKSWQDAVGTKQCGKTRKQRQTY